MPASHQEARRPEATDAGAPILLARLSGPRPSGAGVAVQAALLAVGIVLLALSRLPAIFGNFELNPDESMMMALGSRMGSHPQPWLGIDAATSGPLSPGLLALLHRVGWPGSFGAVHLLAALLLAAILLFGWAAARRPFGWLASSGAFLACCAWMGPVADPEFAHYTSELIPSALIALSLLALVGESGACTQSRLRLLLGCAAAGLAPWAKLQAGPVSLAVCGWAAASWLSRPGRWRAVAAVAAGAALPTGAIVAACAAAGSLREMWLSYFVVNTSYAGGGSFQSPVHRLVWLADSPLAGGFLIILVVSVFACATRLRRVFPPQASALVLLVACASLFVFLKPAFFFPHHMLMLLLPTELGVAMLLGALIRRFAAAVRAMPLLALAYFLAVFVPPQFPAVGARGLPPSAVRDPDLSLQREMGSDLAGIVTRGSSLFVWGWAPVLHVELGAPAASRFAIFHFLVLDTPARPYLRGRLMDDLNAHPPDWIVETNNRFGDGIRANPPFPALAEFIRASYEPAVATVRLHAFRRRARP